MNNTLIKKRDTKAKPHLEQYAPVWITQEAILPKDEAIQFSVAFQHKNQQWVNRRYYYDGFNNTLYYRGQTNIPEEQSLTIQEKEPYIAITTPDTPNSYGG